MAENNWRKINEDMGADLVAETLDEDGNPMGLEATRKVVQKYSSRVEEVL